MCINQVTVFNNFNQSRFGCGCLPTFTPRCDMFPPPIHFGPIPFTPAMPMPLAPMPMIPMYPYSNAMATGYCIGTAMAMPGALQAIGTGLQWGYNNIVKPVWNSVVKPVWNFAKNEVLRPIGAGLRWVWDHTLGWVFKKIEGVAAADKARKAEEAAEAAEEAQLDADLDEAAEATDPAQTQEE